MKQLPPPHTHTPHATIMRCTAHTTQGLIIPCIAKNQVKTAVSQ